MDQRLCDELLTLQRRDLDTRARLLGEGRLYGDYAAEMQAVHRANAVRLGEMLDAHGWPGLALVGVEGGRAAWLIAQHAICTPALQRRFLAALTAAAAVGDAPGLQVAYLTDRVRFHEGRPQLYGTVLDWDAAGELSCTVEDPAGLDGRRRSVGLPPFAEDLARQRREVAAEGGGPPADLAAYRARAREWARSVGWAQRVGRDLIPPNSPEGGSTDLHRPGDTECV